MKNLLLSAAVLIGSIGIASAQTLVLGTGSNSQSQSQSQMTGTGFVFSGGALVNLGGQTAGVTSTQASTGNAANAGFATPFLSANGSTSTTAETGSTQATTVGGCVGLCANAGGAGFSSQNGSIAGAGGFSGFGFTFP